MRSAPIFSASSITLSEVITIWMSSTAMNMAMHRPRNPSHFRVALKGLAVWGNSIMGAALWTSRLRRPMALLRL